MSPIGPLSKAILPPETIEQIILCLIFSDDSPESRRATFRALTTLSKDWSFQARRLELLRLDIGKDQLERLIHHLTTLQDDNSSFRRVPSKWLSVDLTHTEETPYEKLAKLFNLLDLRDMQDLVITGRPSDEPDTGAHLLHQRRPMKHVYSHNFNHSPPPTCPENTY